MSQIKMKPFYFSVYILPQLKIFSLLKLKKLNKLFYEKISSGLLISDQESNDKNDNILFKELIVYKNR